MKEDIEEIKVGVPVFYKTRWEWVVPTAVEEGEVWWKDDSGKQVFDYVDYFTHNPTIPPRPKRKVTKEAHESGVKPCESMEWCTIHPFHIPNNATNIKCTYEVDQ